MGEGCVALLVRLGERGVGHTPRKRGKPKGYKTSDYDDPRVGLGNLSLTGKKRKRFPLNEEGKSLP